MSSSRSFRVTLVLVATLLLSAGIAAGVTVTQESTPDEAVVGQQIQASVTLSELYQNPSYEEWTLRTETELRNVTWTFELVDQAGNTVETNSVDGQNATQSLSIDDGVSQVRVRVTGTVPRIEDYTYDPAPSFLVAGLTHTRQGGSSSPIERYEARHYTRASDEARQAIESAQTAIDAAGGNAQAEETLGSAISAYEGENFDNAVTLAQRAEREASQARQAQQRNQLILYGAIALVVLAIVIAAVYWFLNRDTGSRL